MSRLQFMELHTDKGLEDLNRMIAEEQRDGWELVEKLAVFTEEEYDGKREKPEMFMARMQRTNDDGGIMVYTAPMNNLAKRRCVRASSSVVLRR